MNELKKQILRSLAHPEAEDGLYFNNITTLHEEDEREAIVGTDREILAALEELIDEGLVLVEEGGSPEKKDLIFRLNTVKP